MSLQPGDLGGEQERWLLRTDMKLEFPTCTTGLEIFFAAMTRFRKASQAARLRQETEEESRQKHDNDGYTTDDDDENSDDDRKHCRGLT